MRLLTAAALLAATCAAGAPALASQPAHLTDVQFVEANRCLGLMTSKSMGAPDAAALAQFLKTQNGGRVSFIYDRADQARDDARRDADRAGHDNARLVAERDGVCRTFVGSGSSAADAGSPQAAARMLR
jgi:hypothetical protein